MSVIRPFEDAGSFTVFENAILDHVMPPCAPNTWKIVCVTVRKTRGWHKEEDWISISQFMRLTGIKSRTTCTKAVHDALKRKYLIRKPYRNSYKYALNKRYEIDTSTVSVPKNGTVSKPEDGTVSGYTKDTITKHTNTKNNKDTYNKTTMSSFVGILSLVTGVDLAIKTNYGYLSRIGKELFEAGYSAKDIEEHFGRGGTWYKQHWKGRRNEKPTTKFIRENIKDYKDKDVDVYDKYVPGKYEEFIE
jgi:hypothetical protein